MDGTVKQIRWAEDIRDELMPELEEFERELQRVAASKGNDNDNETWRLAGYSDDVHLLSLGQGGVGGVFGAIPAIRDCQDAKWFIDYGRSGARAAVHAAMSGHRALGGLRG
jgi:hypothetical protein